MPMQDIGSPVSWGEEPRDVKVPFEAVSGGRAEPDRANISDEVFKGQVLPGRVVN